MREVVIQGLVRLGEVMNLIAATKVGKSWMALMMLLSVATGNDWLGRRTRKGRVLLLDNELHDETIQNRLRSVAASANFAFNPDDDDSFVYCDLRGETIGIDDLVWQLGQFEPDEFTLIVLDAKYRFFGYADENSNSAQTEFHNAIDQMAKKLNCTIAMVHHATKGDQSGKSVTDIGSGGGAQSRAVDCHLTIRPHEKSDDLAVLDAAVLR